ncbi:protein dopey [Cladophialophora carrionii]|uniref:Protein dopey n=1 Tax=Cladophialophora carrionii TaxID=86049 RepID=A0A1C1CYA1_9EURO|nr:protein dopey [Cladophialophora carrionii]
MTDAKAVRRYNAGVERALGLWDATNEWADYIAFLSRLVKALQASPPGAEVPFKPTLAKYLALCLKPSLPSGVHQKALEVYSLVFTLLGTERLSQDLPVWLPGVSHTLTFATLTTRPLFLALYDDHLLHLSSRALRPALRAIILSLLPGIEEENSEDFDRTLSTINRVRQGFAEDGTEEFFWQSLFLASITSTSKRPGALVYLTRELPSLGSAASQSSDGAEHSGRQGETLHEAIRAVTTPEPGLLIRCFATGLQDEQPLVQRGFLDLLVSHLPLDAPVLQTLVSPNDLDILVAAAMSVVLRRDMSLNRRLWSWFLGKEDKREGSTDVVPQSTVEPTAPTQLKLHPKAPRHDYFATFGLDSVIRSLDKMLRSEALSPIERARPFRIMLSLMDRWVIGKLPVEALFVPAMQDLQRYQATAPSQSSFDEVYRSANVFFDAIEPQLITSQLFRLLVQGDLELLEFILANFNLQEEEMTTIHLPMLCLAISEILLREEHSELLGRDAAQPLRIAKLLEVLLSLLPPHTASNALQPSGNMEQAGWLSRLNGLYEHSSYVKKAIFETIPPAIAAEILLRNIALIILECLSHPNDHELLGPLTNSFTKAMARTSNFRLLRELRFGDRLHHLLKASSEGPRSKYESIKTVARIVDTLQAFDPSEETLTQTHLLQLIPELLSQLWKLLLPSTPQFHVDAVEQIWNLRMLSHELLLVDSKIAELMCEDDTSAARLEDRIARFSTLWAHTRFPEVTIELFSSVRGIQEDELPWATLRQPVLAIIDGVDASQANDRRRLWLNNLPSIGPIFRIIYAESTHSVDGQISLLGLHRLRKVVTLAKQSAAQRNEFFGQASFSDMMLDICTEHISLGHSEKEIFTTTLSILCLILEEVELRGDHNLIRLLMQLLSQVVPDSPSQEEILDVLQIIFSKPNIGSPPGNLIQVLISGISSKGIDSTIDKWVTLLCNTIPLYSTQTLFANMLRLTACFCDRVKDYFALMRRLYDRPEAAAQINGAKPIPAAKHPERSITNLLAGLEYVLARAHTHLVDQVSGADEASLNGAEKTQLRSMANNRLTVILCMQDTIRLCGQIWVWRISKRTLNSAPDGKSFAYISSRLRTRTRRILEHLADAEPQECLETLMGMWVDATRRDSGQDVTLNLMQSLDGARPKFMMPATFNAVYNRTNPAALDQSQKSSLSVDVSALELMAFLIAYTSALEDDLLEEIWTDCTAFLREVLANPMPHRQILLKLLEFVAVLCQKMENTNFGEVLKMRRELSDLCARLFTAIFTIRPAGLDSTSQAIPESGSAKAVTDTRPRSPLEAGGAIQVLCEALPIISNALGDQDRLTVTLSGIATHVIGPALRSKQFPQTVSINLLQLVLLLAKSQPNNKTWRKDVSEAMNDNKFFQSPPALAEAGWLPVLKQLWLTDKSLMPELVSRLNPPTTAGIMFGVGASAARTEADRKTQLNLRRIALLLLAADVDAFVPDLIQIIRRVEELLTATSSSSPSSSTRGDIYLVLRAITLTFTQTHLVSIWPIVDVELRDLFISMQQTGEPTYTSFSQLQGAKLLDLLLLLKPEEFQLHEWLFVTDTVDAVYPPQDFQSTAISDQIVSKGSHDIELPTVSEAEARKPWLCTDMTRTTEDPQTLLRPFFRQLSIHAFEDTYSLQPADLEACRKDLLADLFLD